jgi:N utilization substance protein A
MRLFQWLHRGPDPHAELRRLLTQEVPEIAAGQVQVRGIGRVPGMVTKLAVVSTDPTVDAVGACVGARGDRIRQIVAKLNGERVEIIPWTPEVERLIKFALMPLEITSLTIDSSAQTAQVVVRPPRPELLLVPIEAIPEAASMVTGIRLDVRIDGAARPGIARYYLHR